MRSPSAVVGALALLLALSGCVKEISSEERLERETRYLSIGQTPDAASLEKIDCNETAELLSQARSVNRPESDRVRDYISLYRELLQKTKIFEDAMTRNPDLQYQEGSQRFADARDVCIQQSADVRVEFERYIRDLVDLPTVQEIKGGHTITVARLDFATLRQGIDSLDPEDKETLMARVAAAEKKIGTTTADEQPARGRR
jgi:hypothetical protein